MLFGCKLYQSTYCYPNTTCGTNIVLNDRTNKFTQLVKQFHIKVSDIIEHLRQLVHVGKTSVTPSLGMTKGHMLYSNASGLNKSMVLLPTIVIVWSVEISSSNSWRILSSKFLLEPLLELKMLTTSQQYLGTRQIKNGDDKQTK